MTNVNFVPDYLGSHLTLVDVPIMIRSFLWVQKSPILGLIKV